MLSYRPVYILGEVTTPGGYPYANGMTVVNAVAVAGGFTYRARKSRITINARGTPATLSNSRQHSIRRSNRVTSSKSRKGSSDGRTDSITVADLPPGLNPLTRSTRPHHRIIPASPLDICCGRRCHPRCDWCPSDSDFAIRRRSADNDRGSKACAYGVDRVGRRGTSGDAESVQSEVHVSPREMLATRVVRKLGLDKDLNSRPMTTTCHRRRPRPLNDNFRIWWMSSRSTNPASSVCASLPKIRKRPV